MEIRSEGISNEPLGKRRWKRDLHQNDERKVNVFLVCWEWGNGHEDDIEICMMRKTGIYTKLDLILIGPRPNSDAKLPHDILE